MKCTLFIDESGSFDEKFSGSDASVVGGVCSLMTIEDWAKSLPFDNSPFEYPEHYHCGPLLGRKLKWPANASQEDVNQFTSDVFRKVLERSLFAFISRNEGKRFEYSPQATYVMNLVTGLRAAFDRLAREYPDIEHIQIWIAQRTIKETKIRDSYKKNDYMHSLMEFVLQQLIVGTGDGVQLAKRLEKQRCIEFFADVAERNAGLIASDFICSLGRSNKILRRSSKESGKLLICVPDTEILLGDYKAFHERQVEKLLKEKYYGSCLDFFTRYFHSTRDTPSFSQFIITLKEEKQQSVLERELPYLLSIVHQLVKQRTELPNMLKIAMEIAEQMVVLAKKQIENSTNTQSQRLWIRFQIQTLDELAACHNHIGSVSEQKDLVEREIIQLIADKGSSIGMDFNQRKTRLLDVRNRNINAPLNDYRFEEAYELAEELFEERCKMIPDGEVDELLGKILGSQGQSMAFMAKSDPSWYALADSNFKKSLRHCEGDTKGSGMTLNFLSTNAWQASDYQSALAYLPQLTTSDQHLANMLTSIKTFFCQDAPEQNAFEILNCLRIAAAIVFHHTEYRIEPELLQKLEIISYKIGTDHPHELWLKWIGVLHLLNQDFDSASSSLVKAKEICDSHQFTMKTIGNSITLVQIIAQKLQNKNTRPTEKKFNEEQLLLQQQSQTFKNFITNQKVIEKLKHFIETDDKKTQWELLTYLPFSYA